MSTAEMPADVRATPAQAPAPTPATPAAAPVADPGPLGLASFALTTFVLSVFNAKLIANVRLEAVVLPLALFYGGIVQVLAGMWEFRKNNVFGATIFTSYGALWLSFAAYVKFVVPPLTASPATAGDVHITTGLFLLAWGIFTTYMLLVSYRVSGLLFVLLILLEATIVFLAWGAFGEAATMTKIGGWLGIIVAFGAWFASFAGLINAAWGRTYIPTWPGGFGRR